MTWSKIQNFNGTQQEISKIAKALSHPARVAILQYLAAQKSCYSGDISNEIPLSRTTVSQHLKALKAAGFIDGEVSGLNICYCLNNPMMVKCKCIMESFMNVLNFHQKVECGPTTLTSSTGKKIKK